MKMLVLTHDLACAFDELVRAAQRYLTSRAGFGGPVMEAFAVSAVAFTIQLAIDVGDRDPEQMRALERDLIDKLRAGA